MMMFALCVLTVLAFVGVHSQIHNCEDATADEFPWQGSLQIKSGISWRHVCSCVLYSPDKALTAAHCLYTSPNRLRVVFGAKSLNSPNGAEQISALSSYTNHHNFAGNVSGYSNDIAVLRLTTVMDTASSAVGTVTLAKSANTFADDRCVITAWRTPCGVSDVLQKSTMRVITNSECVVRMGASKHINDGHICALESEKGACSIDSGGPMICGRLLAGIASWGNLPCTGEFPIVFSRVS